MTYLKFRAIPGVESVDDHSYRRAFEGDGNFGTITVTLDSDNKCLRCKVRCTAAARLGSISRRVGRIFDLDAPVDLIRSHLGRDPLLARALKHSPDLRVPGTWDGFELTVRAIIGQQVAVKSATTVAGRLVRAFGRRLPPSLADGGGSPTHLFPSPSALAGAPEGRIGMPRARAATIRALARAVLDNKLKIDPDADPDHTVRRLKAIKGIGDWTAQYVAMRALRQPDAFPAADLGLLKAASERGPRMTPAQLLKRAEAWRPFRAYAAVLLWTAG